MNCLSPYGLNVTYLCLRLAALWGRPPGLRGSPWTRCFCRRINLCEGEQAGQGAGRGRGRPPHRLSERLLPRSIERGPRRGKIGIEPYRLFQLLDGFPLLSEIEEREREIEARLGIVGLEIDGRP